MSGTMMRFGLTLVWFGHVSHDSVDVIVASLLITLSTVYPVLLDT